MKKYRTLAVLFLFALILCACTNVPQSPTKTPTMNADDMMTAAVSTAEALRRETETQWAIDNPSPTPTDTATPTPESTPTSAMPLIPPTATAAAKPYYHIDDTNYVIREIGNPGNYGPFVPKASLYIEVCFKNGGSGIWNERYYAMCTNNARANISPMNEPVYLGKSVADGEWACFSFQSIGSTEYGLGSYCPFFQMYSDVGVAISKANTYACFTIK
ncbi:MAG: hypothetical protein IJI07_04970 [Flexilinea sp.]|nr:hypothetical protein [Flexilinea sp.]